MKYRRGYYYPLPQDSNEKWRKNKGKPHSERMARGDITFLVYPNGKDKINQSIANNIHNVEPMPNIQQPMMVYEQDRKSFYSVLKINSVDIRKPYFTKNRCQCYVRVGYCMAYVRIFTL
jgi:hypothetical protein